MPVCGECIYFIADHGKAGFCTNPDTPKPCPTSCAGLPFKRVFYYEHACSRFEG